VRLLGAKRFQATILTLMGEAYRQLGDRARAMDMHEQALAIARKGGMSYVGGIVLGYRALAAYEDVELRRDSLREGEQSLTEASVAHNALFFYAFAIESSLLAGDWAEARRFADAFAARFSAERVPFIDFLVDRGRLLAELGENGPSEALIEALRRCRETGRAFRFGLFQRRLEKVLDEIELEHIASPVAAYQAAARD
jgi:tetratricopeptide (TPR) repeat protein